MTEPLRKIYLYKDDIGSVEYVNHMGNDLTVVNAARVSFGTHKTVLEPNDVKLINYLAKHNHTSPFEHSTITFRFVVPLYIRSQHHRHRTWSYNEISRRYTSENFKFYEPKEFRTQHKSNRQASNVNDLINPIVVDSDSGFLTASEAIRDWHFSALRLYENLLAAGVCREQARGVLPQNMYTEYYGTVNLHNLMKFIALRTHEGAQWEIQVLAEACLEIAKEFWPISIEAFSNAKHKQTPQ